MKNVFVSLCVLSFLMLSSSLLIAGGVDNRSNFSGEYVRTLNRNAATDALDAIAYNPAGVMKMEDGKYGNLSIHYVLKDYKNTVDGVALEQDTPSFVPALFALYKNGKWAGFFAFTIPAGGGEVDYKRGNATTKIGATGLRNQMNAGAGAAVYGSVAYEKLKGESFYYGYTLGGAYQFDDFISFSLAGRIISARKKIHAELQVDPTDLGSSLDLPSRTAVLDYEDAADGFGLILGMNINYESFNIGLKYETETVLDFKYNVKEDSITGLPAGLGAAQGVINGVKHSRDLPALFAFGLGYSITPRVKVDTNLTYYFQEDADWGGAEQNVDNGWEAGITLAFLFKPNLKASIGYLYTDTGMDAQYALKEAPELRATSFGVGVVYNWNEKLKMDLGFGIVSYDNDSYTDTSSGQAMIIELDKSVTMFSAGIEYKF